VLLRPLVVLVGLVMVTVTVSCGSDSDPVDRAVDEVVEPFVTNVQRGLDGIEQADVAACGLEREALGLAIDAYSLLNDAPPDEADLVPDWLREQSALYDVQGGVVVPAAGSPCD
jgi:hypothetical protein